MKKSYRADGPSRSGGIVFAPQLAWFHTRRELREEAQVLARGRELRKVIPAAGEIARGLLDQGHTPAEVIAILESMAKRLKQ